MPKTNYVLTVKGHEGIEFQEDDESEFKVFIVSCHSSESAQQIPKKIEPNWNLVFSIPSLNSGIVIPLMVITALPSPPNLHNEQIFCVSGMGTRARPETNLHGKQFFFSRRTTHPLKMSLYRDLTAQREETSQNPLVEPKSR